MTSDAENRVIRVWGSLLEPKLNEILLSLVMNFLKTLR